MWTPGRRKVLVVTPGGCEGAGGIDRMMRSLRDSIDPSFTENHDVEFLASRGVSGTLAGVTAFGKALTRVAILCAFRRVELVHLNVASRGSFYRKLALSGCASMFRTPFIVHLHGALFREFWLESGRLQRWLISGLFRRSASIITLGTAWSEFVKNDLQADGVVVIPNASRCLRIEKSAPRNGPAKILFLGRLGMRKGTFDLIEALGGLQDLDWSAILAGDGDVDEARRAVADYNLSSRIRIPGWVDAEETATMIGEADILVLPSYAENLPMSVIEAMSAGLGVIATDVGAVSDIVCHEETGILLPVAGDVELLAAAIERLILDPELRARLGQSAIRFHSDNLSLDSYQLRVTQLWDEIASMSC